MRVLDKGHCYQLDHLDGVGTQTLQFCNREGGRQIEGVTTQEVIRALIDRTWYCNDCLPWSGNKLVVDHLRMALMLHEVRAMIRGVEKGEIRPEFVKIGTDSHFFLDESASQHASPYARMPETPTETGSLNPGVCSHHEKARHAKTAAEIGEEALHRMGNLPAKELSTKEVSDLLGSGLTAIKQGNCRHTSNREHDWGNLGAGRICIACGTLAERIEKTPSSP